MQASHRLRLKALLSPMVVAMVLVAPFLTAPNALAKKDLFGNEPGSKQSQHIEQLAPNTSINNSSSSSSEPSKEEMPAEIPKAEEKIHAPETKVKSEKESEQEPSYIEKQLSRFKGHLVEAKDDLFGNKKTSKKEVPSVPQQTETALTESSHSSESAQPEIPTISQTEAAQRAQSLAEGQVINVRKYLEDDKPRYAVKLLQKNGRMKTINLDAVSGALIEDKPE